MVEALLDLYLDVELTIEFFKDLLGGFYLVLYMLLLELSLGSGLDCLIGLKVGFVDEVFPVELGSRGPCSRARGVLGGECFEVHFSDAFTKSGLGEPFLASGVVASVEVDVTTTFSLVKDYLQIVGDGSIVVEGVSSVFVLDDFDRHSFLLSHPSRSCTETINYFILSGWCEWLFVIEEPMRLIRLLSQDSLVLSVVPGPSLSAR